MKRLLATAALLIAAPAAAQPWNTPYSIQANVERAHRCEFHAQVSSPTVTVTEIASSATADPDPSALVSTVALDDGEATASLVVFVLDPDSDAFDRNGRSYRVEIRATYTGTGQAEVCVGRVNVKRQDV